ncbi:hypothetical protein PAXRUDRAFT_823228 [Paxillus rubicundulus Ve08.2h10]|uniref:Unplaced genomic scaffold scaffold_51, whole genome shotgun sequence n=1 Tax=Paxillus rubicundulus Ve08.2h10 TaxID=930991 RepID=A0A0D0DKK4_9AGAM|nr:hypothetical protein PAXRUDRAFT_823228 [Paxillus rubicundulus Ve08.2h10]
MPSKSQLAESWFAFIKQTRGQLCVSRAYLQISGYSVPRRWTDAASVIDPNRKRTQSGSKIDHPKSYDIL